MKKQFLRWVGVAAAAAIAVGSIPFGAAVADSAAADDFEMSLLTCDNRQDVYTVSSLDTAEMDVTIRVGVYIQSEQWDADDYIEAVGANWKASDSKYITFQNIANLAASSGEQKSISYSGGTYLSSYEPYCFVRTVNSRKYGARETSRDINVTTTANAYDPIFGSTITQLGENRISFSCSYYASKADKEADLEESSSSRLQTKTYECDVLYDSAGLAYYTFQYIRQDTYAEATAVGYLPRYQADFEVGTEIPGMSDYILWLYKGTSATSFFGESSDEFAFVTFDIVLAQGTPSGAYSVDLATDDGKTYISGSVSKTHYPISANGLTILVDESAPRITEAPVTETTTSTSTSVEIATATTEMTETMTETTAETMTETTAETMTETTEITQTTVSDDTTTSPTTETSILTKSAETTTVPPSIATVTTSLQTTATSEDSGGTTSSSQEAETTTEPVLAQPYLTPEKTIYVEESDTLLLYNAGLSTVTWLSGSEQTVEILECDSTHAVLKGMSLGTVMVYALVNGTVLSCQVTVAERDEARLHGDLNRDGKIRLEDAVLAGKNQMGNVTLDYYALKNADCDANGIVDGTDLLVLMEFLIKKIDTLPYQE